MNNKLDAIDKINMRLEKLHEYVSILRTLKGVKADELKRDINKRAKAERFLQLACEAVIVRQKQPVKPLKYLERKMF